MSIIYQQYNKDSYATIYAYSNNFVADNTTLSNYNYINYSTIKQNSYIFNPKITLQAISNDSLTIVDSGDNLSGQTTLIVQANNDFNEKDDTQVDLYFSLNSNTVADLPVYQANEVSFNTAYLVLGNDANPDVSYDLDSVAIVSFDVETDYTLTNPQVLTAGSLFKPNVNNNSSMNPRFLSSIQNIYVTSRNSGVPLGSTVQVVRNSSVIDDLFTNPSDLADVTPLLAINDNTVTISGGLNYRVNDTFTISGATSNGEIKVTKVNTLGSILSTEIVSTGLGYSSEASAIYNGNTGSGASIDIADDYSILGFTINDGGNGYSAADTVKVFYDETEIFPTSEYTDYAVALSVSIDVLPIGVEPLLNDAFSLSGIMVVDGGQFHQHTPILTLIDEDGNIINNTFITSNTDYFTQL